MVLQSNLLSAASFVQFGLLEVLGVGANEVEPTAGARIVIDAFRSHRSRLGVLLHFWADLGPDASSSNSNLACSVPTNVASIYQ